MRHWTLWSRLHSKAKSPSMIRRKILENQINNAPEMTAAITQFTDINEDIEEGKLVIQERRFNKIDIYFFLLKLVCVSLFANFNYLKRTNPEPVFQPYAKNSLHPHLHREYNFYLSIRLYLYLVNLNSWLCSAIHIMHR